MNQLNFFAEAEATPKGEVPVTPVIPEKSVTFAELAIPATVAATSRETRAEASSQKPLLIIIDGMAMLYRAFFALQRTGMSSPSGLPTGALYGFTTALLKIFENYHPHYLVAAFDSREKTFRHHLLESYKANRAAPPEELLQQLEKLFELLKAFGVPVIKQAGYEADDLIGAMVTQFADVCRIGIVTPDKDLAQLVREGVQILKPGKNQHELEPLGCNEVKAHFGVPPKQFTNFLTLTGDTSDNIVGAKGIGPKTAATLLEKYQTLDKLYQHLDELTPKVRKSLEDFAPNRELVLQLVTICCDAPLHVTLEELACKNPARDVVLPLLQELGFRTIAARLQAASVALTCACNDGGESAPPMQSDPNSSNLLNGSDGNTSATDTAPPPSFPDVPRHYTLVETREQLQALLEELQQVTHIAVDTETTSLDVFEAELAGISLCAEAGKAFFIATTPDALERKEVVKQLKPLLENPAITKSGQNLKYDMLVLKKYGIELAPISFDTMLASYVLNPDEHHNLDDMALRYLGRTTTKYDELTGTGKQRRHIFEVEKEALTNYACQDADVAFQLEEVLQAQLQAEPQLLALCTTMEFPLVRVLATMEYAGIAIDTEHLARVAETTELELQSLTDNIYAAAGSSFNIDSPKQLSHVLFTDLSLPTGKSTKTGFSTDVGVLEELAATYPIASDLLSYRTLQKLKGTYIEALPKIINPRTGRIHTSFNQHITATGRLSSSNPNLQNIPVRTALGKEIRRAFIPSTPEHWLLSADYSQIELRIAAELSGDERLIAAFRNGEDIHTATAQVIFGTEEISSDMRRKAKEVNFGVLYGIQPFGLAKRLNIPQKEAKVIIETYKAKYPQLFNVLRHIIEEGKEKGYVTTLLGRRRYIADLNSRNGTVQKAAERAAMNTPIQGTAADIIKCAMNLCYQQMQASGMASEMLLQVHDELLFETTDSEKEALTKLVENAMKEAAVLCGMKQVPVEVDCGVGKNWLEAH